MFQQKVDQTPNHNIYIYIYVWQESLRIMRLPLWPCFRSIKSTVLQNSIFENPVVPIRCSLRPQPKHDNKILCTIHWFGVALPSTAL